MGRTREFDLEVALKAATQLFWRDGYEGTSISDLTAAMGISAPSLYFAFGSKEALFYKTFEHYRQSHLGFAEAALLAPTAREVAERFLIGYAEALTDPETPGGCFAMNSALPTSREPDPVRTTLAQWRVRRTDAIRARFDMAVANGDLPEHTDTDALARYVMVIAWGMAVEAETSGNRDHLRKIVTAAMKNWPS